MSCVVLPPCHVSLWHRSKLQRLAVGWSNKFDTLHRAVLVILNRLDAWTSHLVDHSAVRAKCGLCHLDFLPFRLFHFTPIPYLVKSSLDDKSSRICFTAPLMSSELLYVIITGTRIITFVLFMVLNILSWLRRIIARHDTFRANTMFFRPCLRGNRTCTHQLHQSSY